MYEQERSVINGSLPFVSSCAICHVAAFVVAVHCIGAHANQPPPLKQCDGEPSATKFLNLLFLCFFFLAAWVWLFSSPLGRARFAAFLGLHGLFGVRDGMPAQPSAFKCAEYVFWGCHAFEVSSSLICSVRVSCEKMVPVSEIEVASSCVHACSCCGAYLDPCRQPLPEA